VFSFKNVARFEVVRGTGNDLQCFIPVRDANGAGYIYGAKGGYLERLEYGNTMDGTAIVGRMRLGDWALQRDNQFIETTLRNVQLVQKVKTNTHSVSMTHYGDGSTVATPVVTKAGRGTSWTFTANATDHRVVSDVQSMGEGRHIWHGLDFQMSTSDEPFGFEPLFVNVKYLTAGEAR